MVHVGRSCQTFVIGHGVSCTAHSLCWVLWPSHNGWDFRAPSSDSCTLWDTLSKTSFAGARPATLRMDWRHTIGASGWGREVADGKNMVSPDQVPIQTTRRILGIALPSPMNPLSHEGARKKLLQLRPGTLSSPLRCARGGLLKQM